MKNGKKLTATTKNHNVGERCGLVSQSGTSMATPHVAGVAALWGQKMLQVPGGSLNALSSKVIGTTTRDGIVAGTSAEDVGEGIAQAPVS